MVSNCVGVSRLPLCRKLAVHLHNEERKKKHCVLGECSICKYQQHIYIYKILLFSLCLRSYFQMDMDGSCRHCEWELAVIIVVSAVCVEDLLDWIRLVTGFCGHLSFLRFTRNAVYLGMAVDKSCALIFKSFRREKRSSRTSAALPNSWSQLCFCPFANNVKCPEGPGHLLEFLCYASHLLGQWSPTTSPWVIWYRAAQKE